MVEGATGAHRGLVYLRTVAAAALCSVLYCAPAAAKLDLGKAEVHTLNNGLTVIVLNEPAFPVVSVQMLYRAGARNENMGATGLAHFLEHMAFRDSKHFPDTGLVSAIDAVGGEWHGYTWLDQTTYYATAPQQHLDLLLRIEADRMARLEIQAEDVAAEAGAVLAEMHGYENDPATMLQDQLLYLTFLAHPYRNNSIGWESDVARITRPQLLDFYQQHYHPANGVLAVVGDISTADVMARVKRHFGNMKGRQPTPLPHTVEPAQQGERRLWLQGTVDRKYYRMAYRSPAAGDPDFIAFLLLQELLAGGSGVSFLQNDWGTPVRATAPLAGIGDELSTWFPPMEQPYVFTIGGSAPADADESEIETAITSQLERLRLQLSSDDAAIAAELNAAKQRVKKALIFDVETTEDAAHQLAFFAGIGALDVLQHLPERLDEISQADVEPLIRRYLGKNQRNIAWYVPAVEPQTPATAPVSEPTGSEPGVASLTAAPTDQPLTLSPSAGTDSSRTQPAVTAQLSNQIPVIVQRSTLSGTVQFTLITPLAEFPATVPATAHQPVWGLSSLEYSALPKEFTATLRQARNALAAATPTAPSLIQPAPVRDPAAMLQQDIASLLGLHAAPAPAPVTPLLLIITGDINQEQVLAQLEAEFGALDPAPWNKPALVPAQPKNSGSARDIESVLLAKMAQEQLGYVVRAPGPGQPGVAAWQMLLYLFNHGYEGRLGKEAISERGLVYYIDSSYRTDGTNGWITLSMGVDPDKLPPMKSLLQQKLRELADRPPTAKEVAEARQHLLGRHVSAAQSNAELADALARQWAWYGHPLSYEELQAHLDGVSVQTLQQMIPAFTSGTIIAVRNPQPHE